MELDKELKNDFLEECKDIIDNIRSNITSLKNIKEKMDIQNIVNSLFRGVHTIKGGSSMFGMDQVHDLAHKLETFMSQVKKEQSTPQKEEVDFIEEQIDLLESYLFTNNNLHENFINDHKQIIDELKKKNFSIFILKIHREYEDKIHSVIEKNKIEKIQEVINENNKLYLLCIDQETISNEIVLFLEKMEQKSLLQWIHKNNDKKDIAIQRSEVLRVPLDKINSSLDNIWEIFLIRNQISFLVEQNKEWIRSNLSFAQTFENLDNILRRNISELESKVMSMRMGALESIFARMKKIIGTYSQETKKQINFQTFGGNTELDKKVIDMLAEPLTHLIRNAMDHGLEDNESRKKAGKPLNGTITLSAFIHETIVTIQVKDDGKGISSQEILKSANNKGIDTSQLKTEDEIISLIFYPGFSTANIVTNVSGRGVGMDAVKSSISDLGGNIVTKTKLGEGTTFSIDIPLGVAVTTSIIVDINKYYYAISSRDIIEVKRISRFNILFNTNQYLYNYNDNYIECIMLEDLFCKNTAIQEEGIDTNVSICIVRTEKSILGLIVSSIIHSTELVIKPLPEYSPKSSLISGVSILESGRPVFMLSLKELYEKRPMYA